MQEERKLSILIIEDDPMVAELQEAMLAMYCPEVGQVVRAQDYESVLKALRKKAFDVILADVMLGVRHFFDLFPADVLGQSKLVFVTGHESFAIQAIKYDAVDYLIKPLQPHQLMGAIKKCVQELKQKNTKDNRSDQEKILLKTVRGSFLLNIAELVRCESNSGYTTFFPRATSKIVVSKTLKEVEEAMLWPAYFKRVHQSHFVNLNYVTAVLKTATGHSLSLVDNASVPVSVSYKEDVFRWIESYANV